MVIYQSDAEKIMVMFKKKKISEKMNLEPNGFQKLRIFKTTIDGWDHYILHLTWYNYYIVL